MKKKENQKLSRRSFLTATSVAIGSTVLASASSHANVEAASNIETASSVPQTSDAYEIGYMEIPSEGVVGESVEARRDRVERLQDRLRSEVFRNQLQRINVSPDGNFQSLIKRATAIESDPRFLEKSVSVSLLGLYTNRRQWKNDDGGIFKMNLSFDPIETENKSVKPVSLATISSSFTAKPNSFVAEYTTFPSLPPIPIAKTRRLGLSFDLIDIADDADKASITKALAFGKKASEAVGEIPGASTIPAYGVALTILNTATSIVDLFVDKPKNKALWGSKSVEGEDRRIYLTASGPEPRKLRPGIYFIAGRGDNNTSPQWERLHLRMPNNPNETGKEGALYQLGENRRFLEPVDFTYVKLLIDFAS